MPKQQRITQMKLVLQYYIEHSDRDIPTKEVVDWATSEWENQTGTKIRDPDRAIRKLFQEGRLIKIRKGIYRLNNDGCFVGSVKLDFTNRQKSMILERDNYKCVICGKGQEHGMELHVDHIKPKELGGQANVDNGQTLCSQHNMMKKALKQTEAGKKMFIHFYQQAKRERDATLCAFFSEVLDVYEKHQIDGHIKWDK